MVIDADNAADALLAPFTRARDVAMASPCDAGTVGLVSHNAPVELVLAAGLRPLRLRAGPQHGSTRADRYMEPSFDGAIRALFERFLAGHYGALAGVVVPRSAEGYLQLTYFLQEVQRWEPELALPTLQLFDVLTTDRPATRDHVRRQVHHVAAQLQAWGGRAVTSAALRDAIAQCNAVRTALAQLNALRREARPRLSGAQMLDIVAAASLWTPRDFLQQAAALLRAADQLPPRDSVRLMVKGSPHDGPGFYTLVESLGATVVADDHLEGERSFEALVDETGDPWHAVADHYHRASPSLRSLPQSAQDARCMELIAQAGVQGVVFYHHAHDDTLGWDYPAQKRLLDARGIASLYLHGQDYFAPDTDAQLQALRPWLDSLRTQGTPT